MNDEHLHTRNSKLLYLAILFGLLISLSAIYVNLVVYENYTQFTDDETAPGALDFYLHTS